jgi:hypothetical protein
MRDKAIDDAEFARLWMEGHTAGELAARYDVSRQTITRYWHRLALPARDPQGMLRRVGRRALQEHAGALARLGVPVPVVARAFHVELSWAKRLMDGVRPAAPRPGGAAAVPGRAIWTRDRDARLLDVPPPGRYRDLAALAEDWGLPMRDVQSRWHRVRAGA